MKKERKRIVVPVACILGAALFAGIVMSMFLARRPEVGPPIVIKAMIGLIGPLFFMFRSGAWVFLIGIATLSLLVTPLVIGIAKCRMLPALLGAILLALLWDLSVFMVCILSNLS